MEPATIFFVNYIIDTLGELPENKIDLLKMMTAKINKDEKDYRSAIRKILTLNDTIDIAILDLWLRNKDNYSNENGDRFVDFALRFIEQYYKEDSKVDVWPPGTLDSAKNRIQNFKTSRGLTSR